MCSNIWLLVYSWNSMHDADEIYRKLLKPVKSTKYWTRRIGSKNAVSWFNLPKITCEKQHVIWAILLWNRWLARLLAIRTHGSVLPFRFATANGWSDTADNYANMTRLHAAIRQSFGIFSANDHRISTFFFQEFCNTIGKFHFIFNIFY